MQWKSMLMLLVTFFGRDNMVDGRKAPQQTKSSFKSVDEKDQSPQAYIPPNPVKYPPDHCQEFNENEEFDFVVVGAGAAGATVARRFAEDPKLRVLLMEAGGDPPSQSDIPSKFGQVDYEGRWHFKYMDTAESGRKGLYCPGKFLGGSTIVNSMNYARGNRQDFDDWEKIGCEGWSYEDVLPYFKKSETYSQTSKKKVNTKYHGIDGPMHHSPFPEDPFTYALRNAITKAQVENGIKYNADINGADQMGVTNLGGMVDPLGYRSSTARAFLLHTPDNLKVCKYSTAISLELAGKAVTGVNFQYNGTGEVVNYKAKAKKEYILSAGPLNSAPLLERSGIGKRDVLENLGIEVKHELPGVGENYQDHFNSGLMFKADLKSEAAPNPLSTPMSYFASYINTTDPKSRVPDVQISTLLLTPEFIATNTCRLHWSHASEQLKDILNKGENVFYYDVIHLRHPNPGSIHITQTEDPRISPQIITNQLTTELEKERIVKASRFIRKFMSSEVLKPFKVEPVVINDCKRHKFNSEEEILCQMKLLSTSIFHGCGMTAMGPRDNPNSVVDPELRVIGLQNLRIVDSGIIPLVPRGLLAASAVMIGEKAADMIKNFWK